MTYVSIGGVRSSCVPDSIDEFLPCLTTVVYDFVGGCKDAVGEQVVHELPNVFDRVELGTFGWQSDNADIGRPSSLSVICHPA